MWFFEKVYDPQYALLSLLKKLKITLDWKGTCGTLLTYLSKGFDVLSHNLLIAELYAYGFDKNTLKYS